MEISFFRLTFVSLILVCLLVVETQQQNENIPTNPYLRRELLDNKGKYYLEWLVDWNQQSIIFNVTCATRGYVRFGIARDSKMTGADIIIGGVHSNGTSYFTDRHSIGQQQPIVDQQQNYKLHFAQENSTHTFLSFSRAFDTCDPNDVPITDDSLFILWAYGETDNEDGEYHAENRGSYFIYLRDLDLTPQSVHEINQRARITGEQAPQPARVNGADVWTFSERFQVPPKRTTYCCNLKRFVPPEPGKKHMIGYNVRMNQDATQLMHHIILFRCVAPLDIVKPEIIFEPLVQLPGQECYNIERPLGPIPTPFCNQLKIGHGIGGRPQFFPHNLGISMGETNPVEYYLLQVHYDNPLHLSNITADIKLDVYYTSNLRSSDAGIITLGHFVPGSPGILLPPGEQMHKIYGHCSEPCTRKMLNSKGVQLAGGLLHTHLSGRRIRVRHFRNGRELPWVAKDDNYKFNFQRARMFKEEKTLLPGDQLSVQCEYDTTERNKTVVGGYGTDQEMCITFLLHYNVLQDYPLCQSRQDNREYMMYYLAGTSNITWSNERLEYVAQSPAHVAGLTISEISDSGYVNWDNNLRTRLRRDHIVKPHVSVCPSLIETAKALFLGIQPKRELVGLPIKGIDYNVPLTCGLDD